MDITAQCAYLFRIKSCHLVVGIGKYSVWSGGKGIVAWLWATFADYVSTSTHTQVSQFTREMATTYLTMEIIIGFGRERKKVFPRVCYSGI